MAVLATVVALLAFGVVTASAHVTVSSPDAAPGGFGQLTFRVPSESDTANTTSVSVKLPTDTPFGFVSTKPVPGWTAKTTTTKLSKPITTDDGTVTDAVSTVTWTADNGGLTPGQYQDFGGSTSAHAHHVSGAGPGAGERLRLSSLGRSHPSSSRSGGCVTSACDQR